MVIGATVVAMDGVVVGIAVVGDWVVEGAAVVVGRTVVLGAIEVGVVPGNVEVGASVVRGRLPWSSDLVVRPESDLATDPIARLSGTVGPGTR
jgi:hypothetical protein